MNSFGSIFRISIFGESHNECVGIVLDGVPAGLSISEADFVTDVESGVAYLKTRKEINKNKIGLMGHSEGGTIAPIVASTSKDVNFIILLAGTGLRGDKLLLIQEVQHHIRYSQIV